ncbi:N-acetylmuramoyl-L-alanine amidase [Tomitella cavernea]|uniref:MurNAc-LAA domain-containing protein n=1 Tax=Tomitella cavernea TaxID=1387982 RepID=A0ABP9C339_9ACTN
MAEIVKGALQQLGADVVMSRGATGWGGCITDRADKANESGADVAVSIHADSTSAGTDTTNHGFHMIIPKLDGITDAKAEKAQADGGRAASKIMRDVYRDSGFTPSNYLGRDGLDERGDVAGPALTEVPLVFVEMGNGSNPGDAKVLESADGQAKHAKAIAVGIATYLAAAARRVRPRRTRWRTSRGPTNRGVARPRPGAVPPAARRTAPVAVLSGETAACSTASWTASTT